MNRDDIIRMARECFADPDGSLVLLTPELSRFAALVAAAEREARERLKHAMREAMYLLDQPKPRVHAAFNELLCALNPELRETKEQE